MLASLNTVAPLVVRPALARPPTTRQTEYKILDAKEATSPVEFAMMRQHRYLWPTAGAVSF